MNRRDLTVTCVRRDDAGTWTARVSRDGVTLNVDRRYGSWRVTPRRRDVGYHVLLPDAAAIVQERVRRIERSEQREAVAA